MACVAGALLPAMACAQIRTDGTLGAPQTLAGPNFGIPANLGRQAGANLYHSFAQFGVPAGGSATFSGPNSVGNIISRVTGGDASSIDGTLRSTIPGANLFLVNPKGILFGPGARLDLGGSFYASTANYLRMADGTRFDATSTPPPVLSMAAPAAFGFLAGAAPAGIGATGSQLLTQPGAGLALVGGPITLGSGTQLRTLGGNLRVAAVGGGGEISTDASATPLGAMSFANVNGNNAQMRSNSSGALAPGRLVIRGGALTFVGGVIRSQNTSNADAAPLEIAASGDLKLSTTQLISSTTLAGRGADVAASGETVVADRFARMIMSTDGAGAGGDLGLNARGALKIAGVRSDPGRTIVTTQATSSGAGGAIRLSADTLSIDGATVFSLAAGAGKGGDVSIQSRDAEVRNGAEITTQVFPGARGRGGDIEIAATGSLSAAVRGPTNNVNAIFSVTIGRGTAGDIRLNAGEIHLSNARVRSYSDVGSTASGGSVTIESPLIILERDANIDTTTFTNGNAGNMVIRTRDLVVNSSTSIGSVSGAAATGRSGDVTIDGSGRLSIAPTIASGFGTGIDPYVAVIGTNARGAASAGNVTINMPEIHLDNGGGINASTFGAANSGQIRINARNVTLSGFSQITTFTFGPAGGARGGGDITLNIAERFEMTNQSPFGGNYQANVSAGTTGGGRGGNILLNAPTMVLNGSDISTDTRGAGHGGSITIRGNDLALRDVASVHASSASGTTGDAGSIIIDLSGRFELSAAATPGKASSVQANSLGSGRSGSIAIRAREIALLDGAFIVAESNGTGLAGSINLLATDAVFVGPGGGISTRARLSDGGDIDIRAGNRVHLRGSEITTSVGGGQGAGGNIFIDPTFVILENSRIVANAFGGPGGNIRIIADYLLSSPGSVIDASSRLGTSGSVQIAALNTNLDSELAALPTQVLDASAMLRDACATRVASGGSGGSSLVGVGRGGLAASPERFAAASYFGTPAAARAEGDAIGLKLRTAGRARLIVGCPA